MKKIRINNLNEMQEFAKKLVNKLYPGCIVTLSGDLGAGKTTLSKFIGKELGVQEVISSPTYTIMKEYTSGKMPLYHYDLYRIDKGMFDYDLEDYLYRQGVSLVEWPEKFLDILPEEKLELVITIVDENTREITLTDNAGKFGDLNDFDN